MRFIGGRLLLVAQPYSYRIPAYLNAAQALGLRCVIASRGQFSLISEVHEGLHIPLDDVEQAVASIVDYAQSDPFSGILGCDDSIVEIAAGAAAALGLTHNPPVAARLSCRKDLARAHLQQAGCLVPAHRLIDLAEPLEQQLSGFKWPVVAKPLNLSGSRGVIRADSVSQLQHACRRIKHILAEQDDPYLRNHVLVERYIPGQELAFEGFLRSGQLQTLAIFDKPDPLEGPYFEETIYVTPAKFTDSTRRTIQQSVADACRAYGLVTGPVHAELRVNEHGAWILEVASRTIGGECARVLDSGSGYSLESLTIALACQQAVEYHPPEIARGVMMIPIPKAGLLQRVEGIASARAVKYIDNIDIVIRPGNKLLPLPEGNQYLGYIFASAESSVQVTEALRAAHACLTIVVKPLLSLVRN